MKKLITGLIALIASTMHATHVVMNNKEKRIFTENRIEMMKHLLETKRNELEQAKKKISNNQSNALAGQKSNLEATINRLEKDIAVAQQSKKGLS